MLPPRALRRSTGRACAARLVVLLAFVLTALATASPAGHAAGRVLDGVVVRIVDGDTVHVRIGDRTETVRYIGVNTPEVHHPKKAAEPGGREAMEVNRALAAGKRVRLELDVQERDRYRRLLAYVWVCAAAAPSRREASDTQSSGAAAAPSRREASGCPGTESVMVNAELVRRGYAQVMTVPPNVRFQGLFRDREREARETGRGLWRGP